VQPHERIKDEQPGLKIGNRLGQAAPIALEIEPQRGRGDDLDVEIRELHAGRGGDALEPPAWDWHGHWHLL
jgi:hypothetical protein